MKDITKIITINIRLFHLTFIIIVILISSSLSFSQDYITELPKEKNQLFWLLTVKVEKIQEENFRTTDSLKVWKKIIKNYYDHEGYLIKKEIFDSSFTIPSFVREYRYDENGLYTKFILNGKLREQREYNDSGKLKFRFFYDDGKLSRTNIFKYDSLGNEIEILTKYSSGRLDTMYVSFCEYYDTGLPLKIKSKSSTFNEFGRKQKMVSEYDTSGRCVKLITEKLTSIDKDTIFYYYNDKNLIDSTIRYNNGKINKYIREYDEYYRLLKSTDFKNTDSLRFTWIFSYDDKLFMTIDSLFQKNDIDLKTISDFEKTGVVLEILNKGENGTRVKIMTQYYSNGLIKNRVRFIYSENKIEKKFYEYEFY